MSLDYGSVLSGKYLGFLIEGTVTTVELAVLSWAIALPMALVLTGLRDASVWPARGFAAAYVEYHRSVPLLVQLLVWYFAIPSLLPSALNDWINDRDSEFIFAVVALSLYSAAYMSEDLRSGLRTISVGQFDAARALGLGWLATWRLVILPQAWRAAVPPLASQALILFKGTSLASAIGVAELSYQARQIETQTFRSFEAFSVATVIYVAGTLSIMAVGGVLARRAHLSGSRDA